MNNHNRPNGLLPFEREIAIAVLTRLREGEDMIEVLEECDNLVEMYDLHCWAEEEGVGIERFNRVLNDELEGRLSEMTEQERDQTIREIDDNAAANKAYYERQRAAFAAQRMKG
jgi:hypothetical protein